MRKQHPSAFKAKIVMEAIKEEKTIAQIASENGIHPNQISQWKSLALAGLPTLFERQNKALTDQVAHEAQTEELYAQIGKLTTQVAGLKKKSGLSPQERRAGRDGGAGRSGLFSQGTSRFALTLAEQSVLYAALALTTGSRRQAPD